MPKQFPRQAQLSRLMVGKDEFFSLFRTIYDKVACYTSLYSLPQIEQKVVDTAFLEIDANCGVCASCLANFLERKLKKQGFRWRKYFSGHRGFHYYLDFEPVKLKRPNSTLWNFMHTLPPVRDMHSGVNMSQMVRLPYTVHPATGLYCVRVNDQFTMSMAVDPPRNGENGLAINHDLPNILLSIDERLDERWASNPSTLGPIGLTKNEKKVYNLIGLRGSVTQGDIHEILRLGYEDVQDIISRLMERKLVRVEDSFPYQPPRYRLCAEQREEEFFAPSILGDVEFYPPCVVECISKLKLTGELLHAGRLHMGSFLSRVGFTLEEILPLFYVAHDFREQYSRRQIEGIIRTDMACYSCRKAQALGMCPYDVGTMRRCGYFPNINFSV